jgi:hypothetical protein
MAIKDRTTLKNYFQSGDTPTQGQFADLIDSLISIEAADVGLTAISALGGTSKVVVIDAGDHNIYYTTIADILNYLNTHDTTDNLAEGTSNLYFTNTRARAAISKSGNELAYNSSTGVISKNKTEQTLSVSGSGFTFDVSAGYNAKITLTGNLNLIFSNTQAGEYYTLKVIQDGSGSHTLTLPPGCKVIAGGAGGVVLTSAANAIDILTFYYDGTNYYVNIGKNYT